MGRRGEQMEGRGGGRINGGGCHFQVLFSTAFQQHIIENLFLIEAPPQAPPSLIPRPHPASFPGPTQLHSQAPLSFIPRPHPASILLAPVTCLFPYIWLASFPGFPAPEQEDVYTGRTWYLFHMTVMQ